MGGEKRLISGRRAGWKFMVRDSRNSYNEIQIKSKALVSSISSYQQKKKFI